MPAHALLARAAGGLLYDPIYDAEFCAALLDLIAREGRIATPGGELVASAAPGFAQLRGPANQPLAPWSAPPSRATARSFSAVG